MLALLYIHKENVPVKLILVYFLTDRQGLARAK